MSFWYTPAKTKLAKGDLDFDTADVRAILVMSNTTCDTEQDAANMAAFTAIDEYDGTGYSEIDLGGVTITEDAANDRVEIDYTDSNFGTAVAAGTRQWVGIVFKVRVDGTAANDFPIAFHDLTPNNGNGGQINLVGNAEGYLQIT